MLAVSLRQQCLKFVSLNRNICWLSVCVMYAGFQFGTVISAGCQFETAMSEVCQFGQKYLLVVSLSNV